MATERRHFIRIQFQTNAHLHLSEGEFAVEVVDISLKGALIRPHSELFATVGSNGVLDISLGEADAFIRMEVTIAHREGSYFGLACREIDLDSITHLRRLVELNVGDESILHRELIALAHLDA